LVELSLVGSKPLTEAAFLAGEDADTLVIDAANLAFASPLDLAGIVATAHWAASDSIAVALKLPKDPKIASYLQRMDVLRQMPSRTQILGRVPPEARTDQCDRLMEVTALNERTVNDLSERLGPLVTSFYDSYSHVAGAAVFRACSELMSNATEHGGSERGAFIAAQLHTGGSTDEGPRLEFAVCDTGIGVMNHLRQNPRHAHLTRDELAIAKALQAGVSGIAADLRGNGLSDAIEHSRRFGSVNIQIRSGRGEVKAAGSPSDYTETKRGRPDQTSGTWAWLTHRLHPCGSIEKMKPEKR
jgi:hypothetical protein